MASDEYESDSQGSPKKKDVKDKGQGKKSKSKSAKDEEKEKNLESAVHLLIEKNEEKNEMVGPISYV